MQGCGSLPWESWIGVEFVRAGCGDDRWEQPLRAGCWPKELPSPALFAVKPHLELCRGAEGLLRSLLAFSADFFWTFLALLVQLAQEARFGRWAHGPPVLTCLLHSQERMVKSGHLGPLGKEDRQCQ